MLAFARDRCIKTDGFWKESDRNCFDRAVIKWTIEDAKLLFDDMCITHLDRPRNNNFFLTWE